MIKELKNAFKNRDFFLPEDAIGKKENGDWVIADKEKKEIYSIRKAKGKLNIYKVKIKKETFISPVFMNLVLFTVIKFLLYASILRINIILVLIILLYQCFVGYVQGIKRRNAL